MTTPAAAPTKFYVYAVIDAAKELVAVAMTRQLARRELETLPDCAGSKVRRGKLTLFET